jgi:O-antigen/teichoic acid export membrane protein
MQFRQLALTSGLYGGAELLGRAAQALAVFALAALMPKAVFGQVGMLLAIQQMSMALCLGGLVESVAGRFNQFHTEANIGALARTARWVFWATSAAVMGTGTCLTAALGLFDTASTTLAVVDLFAAAATGVALAYVQLETSLLRLQERHKEAIGKRVAAQILGFGIGLAVTVVTPTPTAFFFAVLLGVICAIVLTGKRDPTKTPASEGSKPMICSAGTLWYEGLPFTVATVVSWASGYGANFFIFFWLGQESVAEYTLVLSATTALVMVANAVNQAWSPRFLKLARETDRITVDRANLRATRLLQVLLSMAAALTLALFPVVLRFGGSNLRGYDQAFDFLALALVAFVLLGPYYSAMNYYFLHRSGSLFARIVLVASAVGLPVWFLLVAVLGNPGIYLGWALITTGRGWAVAVVAQRRWGFELDVVRGCLPILGVVLGWGIGRYLSSLF